MKVNYTIQEWLADHITWVQYPNVFGPLVPAKKHKKSFWLNEMPIGRRVTIAMLALFWVMFLGCLSGIIIIVTWAFIGAALGFH